MEQQKRPQGSLRSVMPQVAETIDLLREALGREWVDRQILGGKQGRGTCYAWELGPDGVLRDFGSWHDRQRVQLVDDRVVPPPRPKGVAPCIPGPRGPKQRGHRGEDS